MPVIRWISAFLDLPPATHARGVEFWRAVTGYGLSEPRGEHDEFATLLPTTGDAFLRVQRVLAGPASIHLDLHVDDPREAADHARRLGAEEVADRGYVVLSSPGGLAFCFVPHHDEAVRPAPVRVGPATSSNHVLLDQVCIDVPSSLHERECAFWEQVTGWAREADDHEEFTGLARPAHMPLRILVQRLGEPTGATRAHLDVSASDRMAEVARHVQLGAELVAHHDGWSVLRDPAGSDHCIVERDETRMLP